MKVIHSQKNDSDYSDANMQALWGLVKKSKLDIEFVMDKLKAEQVNPGTSVSTISKHLRPLPK